MRISLPRGTEINDGDVLALEGTTAVVARAAPEALYVVSPGDAYTWGVAGYQLGNLHRPVRFTEDGMLTPADPMVADLLTRLGIAFEERTIPFVGRRYGAHGAHHHDHHDTTMTTDAPERLLYLLQVANASFPTGAFNHSYGFETWIDSGALDDAAPASGAPAGTGSATVRRARRTEPRSRTPIVAPCGGRRSRTPSWTSTISPARSS